MFFIFPLELLEISVLHLSGKKAKAKAAIFLPRHDLHSTHNFCKNTELPPQISVFGVSSCLFFRIGPASHRLLQRKDVDEKEGKKRQKVLDRFLEKISAPNKKVRNRKKYRVVKNLYFESNDVLSFKLSDNNYCAIICAQITQEKSQTTYDFVLTTYKGKQKPTIETLKDEFIVGHLMGGPSRKEILKQQPKINILWDYHTHNAILLTETQRQRTYSNDSIEIFEGKKEFFFGFPFKLVTHKDMTLMKDKFEVIGKLKIKENFNRSGGYDYLSNLERFEDILNDIDRHMEIFRNVKFPIKLLCEIN